MQATRPDPALLAGALDHLLNYLLRGCGHSAHRAGLLLARLAEEPAAGAELRLACQRMSDRLDAR
jgi:hypothetical protein